MALLDLERGLIVIRVVYDGPPEAGKTTSLRMLAGSLNRKLYSPEEQDGRTLYFDWVDYVGGRFEGYQIRCQIVSVPGQRHLLERRRRLLREADVVVFVADSKRAQLGATLGLLSDLPALLPPPPPSVGVILQANKRDLPDAVPLPELRAAVESSGWNIGVVESVASEGTGIRETFVFAVRLALDRVRELLRTGTLERRRPDIDDGEALLASVHEVEGGSGAPAAAAVGDATGTPTGEALATPALLQVLAENTVSTPRPAATTTATVTTTTGHPTGSPAGGTNGGGPRPPDSGAPSGAIWPPVEGRMILHEASSGRMVVHRAGEGAWASEARNGWRAHSSGDAVYCDVEGGREMLIKWARLHMACAGFLSPRRCVVVADAGDGTWRLWQIVRAEPSLRDYLEGIERRDADDATARLLESAAAFLDLESKLSRASCALPCTLDTVGRGERGAIYIGLMPMTPTAAGGRADPDQPPRAAETELELVVCDALFGRRRQLLAAVERARRGTRASRSADLIERLIGRASPS